MATPGMIAEAEAVAEVPYDTADPEVVNAARKRAGRRDRNRLDVVAGLMDLKEGRAWMHGVLADCHIWATSYMANDPMGTAFKEGERNVGLRLLADVMKSAPTAYTTMCEESAHA